MYKSSTAEDQSTNKGSEGGPSVKSSYNKAWRRTKVVFATAVLATILLLQGLVVMCFTLLCFPIYVLASLLKAVWIGIFFVADLESFTKRLVSKLNKDGQSEPEDEHSEPNQDSSGRPAWYQYLLGCLLVGLFSPFLFCEVLCISLKSLCMLTYRCMTNYFKALTSFYNKCMEQPKLGTEDGCSNLCALVIESFCEQFVTHCKELKQCWNDMWGQKGWHDPSNPKNPLNFDFSAFSSYLENLELSNAAENIFTTVYS